MKTYSTTTNDAGQTVVQSVEIFKLGESKGYNYDGAWFDRYRANWDEQTADGYRPSVFVGHNSGFADGVEKSAIALFDNPRLNDKQQIEVDLILQTDGALKLFQSGMFPHRSVEVYPDKAWISGVALLGGSEPYFKFPPLSVQKFTSGETAPEQIRFEEQDPDSVAPHGQALGEPAAMSAPSVAPHGQALGEPPAAMSAPSVAPHGHALGEPAATPDPTPIDPHATRFAELLGRERDFTIKQFEVQFETLAQAGLAKPVIDRIRALRTALVHDKFEFELKNGSHYPGIPVKFTTDGQTVESTFSDQFDELLVSLAARAESGTLFAKTAPATTGITPEKPAYAETGSDTVLNSDVDRAVRARFAEQGKTSWTHLEYSALRREIESARA